MSTLLAKAASLVTTRSTMSTFNEPSDSTYTQGDDGSFPTCSADTWSSIDTLVAEIVGSVVAGIIICAIVVCLLESRLRKSKRSICDLFRPITQYFIFRRCCGKKRKHYGPLEEGYQSYDMFRSQGQHDTEAGLDKGFENIAVSGASRTPENRGF